MKFRIFLILIIAFLNCKSNVSFLSSFKSKEPVVWITYHDEVAPITILLQESNIKFKIQIFEEPYTENSFALISLGENFPIHSFLEIMSYIRNYYPGLRYIEIIEQKDHEIDISYTLWIGNKTEIAIKKNLKAWEEKDFKKLLELKSKEEIHNWIKLKNQGSSISKPIGQ